MFPTGQPINMSEPKISHNQGSCRQQNEAEYKQFCSNSYVTYQSFRAFLSFLNQSSFHEQTTGKLIITGQVKQCRPMSKLQITC